MGIIKIPNFFYQNTLVYYIKFLLHFPSSILEEGDFFLLSERTALILFSTISIFWKKLNKTKTELLMLFISILCGVAKCYPASALELVYGSCCSNTHSSIDIKRKRYWFYNIISMNIAFNIIDYNSSIWLNFIISRILRTSNS